MAITVIVGGLDVTERVEAGSLQWEDQVNGRGQLTVKFMEEVRLEASAAATGTPSGLLMAVTRPSVTYAFATPWHPEDGAEILVYEDGVRRFGGNIFEPESEATPEQDALFYTCTAVEFSAICDRILVARAYTNKTLREIVVDIVSQDMAEEGIDVSGVEDGPVIDKAIFNWESVTQAFNELAELAGMAWRIDENKVLQFRDRASIAAPTYLANEKVAQGSLRVRPDRQNYRNHQVLRCKGLTDPRTESFVGDGERRTFSLSYKVGTEPTVTVNGVSKTVGIRQVETGKDWYWNKAATEVSQDSGGTPLTSGDTLAVTYQGMFESIISAQRGAEVAARRTVEGGSGRYSRVEERANIDTLDAAIAATQAILNRYGTISGTITCLTDEPGFAPGQLVAVSFPQHGIITGNYLVESIRAHWPEGTDGFWYSLRLISGDPYGGWQEYFRRLMKIGRQYVINENEVVVGLAEFADAAAASDDGVTVATGAPESRVGYAAVGFSACRAA